MCHTLTPRENLKTTMDVLKLLGMLGLMAAIYVTGMLWATFIWAGLWLTNLILDILGDCFE